MKLRRLFGLAFTTISLTLLSGCNNQTPTEEKKNDDNVEHVHTYTDTVISPTCEAEGYTLRVCECGDVKKENITPKVNHEGDFLCKYCSKDLNGESFYKSFIASFKEVFTIDVSKLYAEAVVNEYKEELSVAAKAYVYIDELKNPVIKVEAKAQLLNQDKIMEFDAIFTNEANSINRVTYENMYFVVDETPYLYSTSFIASDQFDGFFNDASKLYKDVVGYVNTITTFFSIVYDILPLEAFETVFDLKKTDTGYIMNIDQETIGYLESLIKPLFTDTCKTIFNGIIEEFAGEEAYKQLFNNDAALFYSDIDNLTALLKSIKVSELMTLADDYIGKILPYASLILGKNYADNNSSFKNVTGLFNLLNEYFDLGLEIDETLYETFKDLDVFSAVAKMYGISDSDALIEIIHDVLYDEDEGIMYKHPIDVISVVINYLTKPKYYRLKNTISFSDMVEYFKAIYLGLKDASFDINLDETGKIKSISLDLTNVNFDLTIDNQKINISNCGTIVLDFGGSALIDTKVNKDICSIIQNSNNLYTNVDFVKYLSDTYFDGQDISLVINEGDTCIKLGEDYYDLDDLNVKRLNDGYLLIIEFYNYDTNEEIIAYVNYDSNLNVKCYGKIKAIITKEKVYENSSLIVYKNTSSESNDVFYTFEKKSS